MQLTKNNYFSKENKYISNSKINSWVKDPNYFYRKHILCEIKQIETQPLRIGRATDFWLSYGEKKFKKHYIAVSRRNLKNPPKDITELPNGEYEMVRNMCEKATAQQAYKDLDNYERQVILTKDIPNLKDFKGICGIPDFFKIEGDRAIIVDLKTSVSIDPRKYYWKCLDFSYFRQMAIYGLLVSHNYPQVKNIVYKHFTIEKDSDGIFNCQTFILDQERVEMEKESALSIIKNIAEEKDFAPKNISWGEAIEIGEIREIENEII